MTDGFSIVTRNGVRLISVDCINRTEQYQAYYSTGFGGVSRMPGECSMNLSLFKHCKNDTTENIHENFRRFADACGFSLSGMSAQREVHGNNIAVVDFDSLPTDLYDATQYHSADGQITRDKRVSLFVYAADCVTIMLADPVNHVFGTTHCGWRNSVNGTIHQFISQFVHCNGDPSCAIAALGPAISAKNYSVSGETAELFQKMQLSEYLGGPAEENRWKIDLAGIDRELLRREGLSDHQIYTAPWCTFEATDLRLPSYRRDKGLNATLGGILYHI